MNGDLLIDGTPAQESSALIVGFLALRRAMRDQVISLEEYLDAWEAHLGKMRAAHAAAFPECRVGWGVCEDFTGALPTAW